MGLRICKKRLERLRARMQENNIDCVVLFSSRNVYYFSGTAQYSSLIVPLTDDPVLLVRVNMELARKDTWIQDVRDSIGMASVKKILSELKLDNQRIGIEENLLSATFCKRFAPVLRNAKILNIAPTVYELRMVKSPEEVSQIRRAATFTNACHEKAREVLMEGMQENTLAAEVEYAMRKAGNEGFIFHRRWRASMFHGMMASGPNIAIISGYGASTITGTGLSKAYPYGASDRKISRGEPIVIDYVGCSEGYYCDEARTYVMGKADSKLRKVFQTVLSAEQKALEWIKPGTVVSQVYDHVLAFIKRSPFKRNFMGCGKYVGKYVGHGLGLEIDEPPIIGPDENTMLEAGMVIAIEPKILLPGYGGAQIEDTVLVTEDGYEILTQTERKLLETI